MKKVLLFLLILSSLNVLKAQSDLLVTPYRVIFEKGKTLEELTVANTGKDTARYNIGFLQYKMADDGVLKQIAEPEEGILFADKYLRVFPRTVVLAPNEAQIVRVQVRLPAGLAEGEYRSHLYFRSDVEEAPDMGDEVDTTKMGIRMIPVYGVSIPIILRNGDLNIETGIEKIAMLKDESGNPKISFDITRKGTMSTFGQIEVNHITPEGQKTLIGKLNGLAIYPPLSHRSITIPMAPEENLDLKSGKLQISYFVVKSGKKETYFDHTFDPE